jgi:hypothetical protein
MPKISRKLSESISQYKERQSYQAIKKECCVEISRDNIRFEGEEVGVTMTFVHDCSGLHILIRMHLAKCLPLVAKLVTDKEVNDIHAMTSLHIYGNFFTYV